MSRMDTTDGKHCRFALAACVLSLPAYAASLDEVIVTATRSPVALVSYAGSATRIAADASALVGATHSSELLNRAAGAMIQRGSGQESLTALRSPVLTGAGACGAVLVLEDGIPIRPVGTCNVNELFEVNLEQAAAVEVLRGPGSVLYGSSAVHGIINVIPPMPDEIPQVGLALEGGSDAWRRVRLAASRDGNGHGLGLVMHATDDGGWRDAAGFEEQKLNAVWVQPAGPGTLKIALSGSNLDQETAGFIFGEGTYRDRAVARSNPNPEAFRDATSLRVAARYLGAAGGELRAYLRSSRMDFLQHFLLGQPVEDNGQDSGGVMLSTRRDFGGGELTAGLDAELAQSSLLQHQAGPTTGGPPEANAIRPAGRQYDYQVDSSVIAAYASWRRPLAPRWSLEAGLRFEQARYDYDNRMIDGNTDESGVPCPGGCLYARPADRSDEFSNVAPRIGLVWNPADPVTAYLSLRAGSARRKRPSSTGCSASNRSPTSTPRRWMPPSSACAGACLPPRSTSPCSTWTSATWSCATRRDSPSAAGARVTAGSNTRATGRSPATGRCRPPAPSRATNTASPRIVEQGEPITSGNDVDTAPRGIHALRLRHDGPWLEAELEWLWIGPYWANAANTARYGGHDVGNLRVSVEPARNWLVSLRVTNLADAAYADRADFAFGDYRYFPGRGRAYFVELGWRKD